MKIFKSLMSLKKMNRNTLSFVISICIIMILVVIITRLSSSPLINSPILPPIPKNTQYQFTGKGYGRLKWPIQFINPTCISLTFKTTEEDGVLFSFGDSGDPTPNKCKGTEDNPCNPSCLLTLMKRCLVFIYSNIYGTTYTFTIPNETIITDNKWHTVYLNRLIDYSWSLIVDNIRVGYLTTRPDNGILSDILYIGWTPVSSEYTRNVRIPIPPYFPTLLTGFIGCIDNFKINDHTLGDYRLTGNASINCI